MTKTKRLDLKSHVRMFGKAVVKLRENVRMGQKELAKRAGLPLPKLARIENGTASADSFGLTEIVELASCIKATPYELMKEYERLVKKAGKAWC